MVVTTEGYLQTDLSQVAKIGEGRYRKVFRVGNKALKVLRPFVRKDYGLFHVNFPTELYTKYKFGIADFNQFEYEMYHEFIERISPELRNKFSQIHEIGKSNGKSVSLSDLVVNSNGNLAKTLSQYGIVDNPDFWRQIDKLEQVLVHEEIPIIDIRGENIMVREVDGESVPILVDFKRYGRRTYPVQIWLFSKQQLVKKMKRRFQRLRDQYKPS